jgi:TPP-dependent 2-oxoacid decarboxylase
MVTAPPRLTDVTGGEVVVAALALHDVDLVFGIPGTHNLSVFDALTRYGVRTVATTHEQGSGYAADGYARTSGRPVDLRSTTRQRRWRRRTPTRFRCCW